MRRGTSEAVLNSGPTVSEITRIAGRATDSLRLYPDVRRAGELPYAPRPLSPGQSVSIDCVSSSAFPETSPHKASEPPGRLQYSVSLKMGPVRTR